jgi:hypothetical protein
MRGNTESLPVLPVGGNQPIEHSRQALEVIVLAVVAQLVGTAPTGRRDVIRQVTGQRSAPDEHRDDRQFLLERASDLSSHKVLRPPAGCR